MLYSEFSRTKVGYVTNCSQCNILLYAYDEICVQTVDIIQRNVSRQDVVTQEYAILCHRCERNTRDNLVRVGIQVLDVPFDPVGVTSRTSATVRTDS